MKLTETEGRFNEVLGIRLDWHATRQGILGGLTLQRTQWIEPSSLDIKVARREARTLAEAYFKPIHEFDGEYLQGIVVVQPLPEHKIRFITFINPYAHR